eukprot:gene8149-biopygen1562
MPQHRRTTHCGLRRREERHVVMLRGGAERRATGMLLDYRGLGKWIPEQITFDIILECTVNVSVVHRQRISGAPLTYQ